MDTNLKSVNKQVAVYTERIAAETRRMEADTQAKREETSRKLEQARADVVQVDTHLKSILDQQRTMIDDIADHKKNATEAENAKSSAQRRIQEIGEMVKQCKQQQQNALQPYGLNIKEILEQIGRMKWHGDKPLGPLGKWVQVKDPRSWADLLRSQLGHLLTAFAVTDSRDRSQLKRLLDQHKKWAQSSAYMRLDAYF
jgi:chromosome segregation ATPase